MRKQQTASTDIEPGDLVVAIRDGKRSPSGFPVKVPRKGHFYIIDSVYPMWYGLGCTIQGMNAKPYKGFFLVAHGFHYFKKVDPVELGADEDTQLGIRHGIEVPATPVREPEYMEER